MDREQAMLQYQQEVADQIQEYRGKMGQYLLERSEQLEEMIKGAMRQLGEQMREQQKEYVSFLYISLLKTDVINRHYQFHLHALNHQWYLDEEPIEIYVAAGDLYQPLNEIWDYLIEKSRPYIGVINQYDIQHLIFDELKYIDSSICQILRYRLRDWEQKMIFADVALAPYWLLKWGEYRDQSEFILQTDRVKKEQNYWKDQVKKLKHKPETLVFSYWYQDVLKDSRLSQANLIFSVFEESQLNNLTFSQCNMEGSRFTKSSLSGCDFDHSNLWGADFSGCTFENVSFQGAELTGALFPAASIPFLNLEPEQLQTVLLEREED